VPAVRFRYLSDPLFLIGCSLYALNRWLLKPHLSSTFLRFWFNDLLLIPCALPVALWLFRMLGLRDGDEPPSFLDLTWILVVWSLLFEWIGPKFIPRTTADWRDVIMYWMGGICAWLFWQFYRRPVFADEL
jgi:hypothetical protein